MFPRLLATLLLAVPTLLENVDPRMDQVVQSYVSNNQFMGSVLVSRDGQVLMSKGYGSANLEWGIPNTPGTKFRLGSITKQFTAASILLLEERGKLRVEDPVKKYLPDAPAAWDKMTIYHVLTHTAGIPNFTNFPDYGPTKGLPTTPAKLVSRFRDKPLEFEPGQGWNYSNSGYVLLGYLVERISGQSYEKFVQENIFTPAGMKDSGYDSNSTVIAHRASGYTAGQKGLANSDFVDMTVPFAAGALYSTTEDLLRWETALFGGKILKSESLQKMTTPFKNEYAFGLTVRSENGHKMIEHAGGIEGFNTELVYYPDEKLTVAVLSNINGAAPQQIATRLAALARGEAVVLQSERKEITVDPKVLSRYVGAYQMPGGPAVMLITLDGTQLISQLTGQQPIPIFPMSETKFFPKVVDAELEFSGSDAQGRATQMTLHQNGRDMPATRLSDAEFKRLNDAQAALAKRIKDQTPFPEGEAAVRRIIEELRSGKPDYDRMSPGLATATRQQLPQIQPMITRLGAIQSITFKGIGPAGADIFEIKFENGSLEYRVMFGPDGKEEGANMRPLQ